MISQPEAKTDSGLMSADEKSHARLMAAISGRQNGLGGSEVAQLEGRHRATGGNALRAAVLGANDGLVSVLSLTMGAAGANLPGHGVLITGIAGLLAGASSMALGEWLSVQSSRELYQNQIKIEAEEIEHAPQEEQEELALIYQSKGLPEERAREMAAHMMADKANILDTLSREELGIDPEELGGSPWVAAVTSFFLFLGRRNHPALSVHIPARSHRCAHQPGFGCIGSLPHWSSHHFADRQECVGFRFPAGINRAGCGGVGFRCRKIDRGFNWRIRSGTPPLIRVPFWRPDKLILSSHTWFLRGKIPPQKNLIVEQ